MLPRFLNYQGKQVLLKYHKLLTGRRTAPPNSLPAVREVVSGGAGVLEFDVSLTADGHFVLLHDLTLQRETTGVGPLRKRTLGEVKTVRLRDSDEPPADLQEVVGILRGIGRPTKVQVDLKELLPLGSHHAAALVEALQPLREHDAVRVVIGCLGDWNLRALHRLDPELQLGLDFAYHLDAPVDDLVRLPTRLNAYGYLDDHPLGYRALLSPRDYLEDRVETLLSLVPSAAEFYLRKDFVHQALRDGFNPIAFIHDLLPNSLVDVWTLDHLADGSRDDEMRVLLDAGADQITTNTPLQWAEVFPP
ncbi:MAG: glycerophosphodiester phosphodiesterase [Deinococcota bacterium]|jgi:glycerophosphoryl diester phosphodiesterase|nr:glycerophosphodiester phosphodiesterase [Deinococcota bacterium]